MILWKVSFAGMNFGQRYDIVGNKFFWHELQVLITQNQIFQPHPLPPPPSTFYMKIHLWPMACHVA